MNGYEQIGRLVLNALEGGDHMQRRCERCGIKTNLVFASGLCQNCVDELEIERAMVEADKDTTMKEWEAREMAKEQRMKEAEEQAKYEAGGDNGGQS